MTDRPPPTAVQRLKGVARAELRQLLTVQPSDRPWQLPLAAALAIGAPLLVATACDRLADGLAASLGGLVLLHLPATAMRHRLTVLGFCAAGFVLCYGVGWLGQPSPVGIVACLTLLAIVATALVRWQGLGPPGGLFFIMVAAIGAYTPVASEQFPVRLGLVAAGAGFACVIAWIYSRWALRTRAARPPPPRPGDFRGVVVHDAVVIGIGVGASLALAEALQLEKPYWVPVACMAVLQSPTLRAAWQRQVHRVLGTTLGLLLAWALLAVPFGPWALCLLLMTLTFAIETAIVRHYAFGIVLVTPLALLLAEAATQGQAPVDALIRARFVDTVLGSAVGFAAAIFLHRPRARRSMAVKAGADGHPD